MKRTPLESARTVSRRHFLVGAAAVGATAALGCATAPASDRIRIALIGAGSQATGKLAPGFGALADCEIVRVCDADIARADALTKRVREQNARSSHATATQDMRTVFDDATIDAVVVATPHHWHALAAVWAMQAGKHVYLEKPVTHTLAEGAVLRAAASYYGRVVQSGTHRRASTLMDVVREQIEAGVLGKVDLARCVAYRSRKPIGAPGAYAPPTTVDLELWSGPAPVESPIVRPKFHYDWHFFWPYGDGGLGNNGVHRVDLARWGLGLTGLGDAVLSYGGRFGPPDAGETPNTQVVVHKFGEVTVVQELRGMPTEPRDLCSAGVVFYGSEGRIVYESDTAAVYDNDGKLVRQLEGDPGNPYANFLAAVHADDPTLLRGGLEEGIQSAALCHVGSLSHRSGGPATDADVEAALQAFGGHDASLETLELTRQHLEDNDADGQFVLGQVLKLDPNQERIVTQGDVQAMTQSPSREGFVLPKATELA